MATQAPVKTAPAVNLFDHATQQCPYDAYKMLRDEAPAYEIAGTGMWVVAALGMGLGWLRPLMAAIDWRHCFVLRRWPKRYAWSCREILPSNT